MEEKDIRKDMMNNKKYKNSNKSNTQKGGFDWKDFGKSFAMFFIIITIVMVPVRMSLAKIGDVRLFTGEENLMKDMNYVINPDSPFYSDYKNTQRVNILMMGANHGLTDTMMLGSYDMKNQRVDVISIPRDTYFYRAGQSAGGMKINSIYAKHGAAGTAEAISQVLLGIPINYYAVVEYADIENIVNFVGGVPLEIPFRMKYYDPYDKPKPLKIDIPEGNQTLDGETAVKFLRYRDGYAEGDIGRVKAQQEFMKAAFEQALKKGIVQVAGEVMKTIDSDITLGMSGKIATKAVGLDSANITTYLTPGKARTENGASYWFTNTEEIEEMIHQIYSEPIAAEDETKDGADEKKGKDKKN